MKMLIVHEFGVMRTIISRYAMAEFDDVQVSSAASAKEALRLLKKTEFDVVLSALEMAGLDGLDLYREMLADKTNRTTPFIIITSTDTPAQAKRLAGEGVEVLISPFRSGDLREMINRHVNQAEKRVAIRLSVPGLEAVLDLDGARIPAEVVNVSLGGLLCEFSFLTGGLDFLKPIKLDLTFPPDFGGAEVTAVTAALVRLSVIEWAKDEVGHKVRTAWRFIDLDDQAENALADALEAAALKLTLGR